MEHAKPGSILSMENIWAIRNVGKNNISRLLAPLAARLVLSSSGYWAVLQFITAAGCALLLFLTYASKAKLEIEGRSSKLATK